MCAVFRREMERETLQLKLIKLNSMMSTKVRSTVNQWDINIHNLSNSRSTHIVCGELRPLSRGIRIQLLFVIIKIKARLDNVRRNFT